jgi:type III pantothenate kinase
LSSKGKRGDTLLVDVGNTRVKWARLVGGRIGRQHAAAHAGWTQNDFARRLFKRSHRVERILVVSVAGARVERIITAAARRTTGVSPELFASKRRVAGVTTAYSEPWRLGADRLAGVIGAHHFAPRRAVCVIGVGTALTVDLVDAQGRHRGGAIVPAPALMKSSLLTKTSGIRRRAQGGSSAGGLFARSTRAAIEQGSRFAAVAVIDRAVDEARKVVGRTPLVILTGGGVPALRSLIRARHVFVPDLVLRGLAVIASEAAKKAP